ncbi:hypothetical protein BZA77DRAFT_118140 [Pyronema omphalodes]|nr:hypothetical protein BZA77DRAFT_118140 [Pyronema omphalodes]
MGETSKMGLSKMPLQPTENIIFVMCIFVPSAVSMIFTFYLRFFHPRASDRPRTTADKIGNFLFCILCIVSPVVVGLDTWICVYGNQVAHLQEGPELDAFWTAGFKIDFFNQLAWITVMWCIKGCFMCMYNDIRRVSSLPKNVQNIMKAASFVLVLSFFLCAGMNTFWCTPWDRNWELSPDKCSAQTSPFAISWASVWHVISDSLVLTVPILIFRHIALHRKDFSAFIFIIFLGLLTVGIGVAGCIVRMISVFTSEAIVDRSRAEHKNILFIEAERKRILEIRLISMSEATCGLFVLCLPTMRAFFRRKKGGSSKYTPPPTNDELALVESADSYVSLPIREGVEMAMPLPVHMACE